MAEPISHRLTRSKITMPEFTSVCPKNLLPGPRHRHARYVPDKLCLELKIAKNVLARLSQSGNFSGERGQSDALAVIS